MDILNISKKDKKVNVVLSSDELVKLCDILHSTEDRHSNDLYYKLYGEMMIARDLCQYGHIDGFCFDQIIKCRYSYMKLVNGGK